MALSDTSFRLSNRDRRVLRALAPVVCGPGAIPVLSEPAASHKTERQDGVEPILRHVEATLASFSGGQRSAILIGLRAFELLAAAQPLCWLPDSSVVFGQSDTQPSVHAAL